MPLRSNEGQPELQIREACDPGQITGLTRSDQLDSAVRTERMAGNRPAGADWGYGLREIRYWTGHGWDCTWFVTVKQRGRCPAQHTGRTDVPLTVRGEQEALSLGDAAAGAAAIVLWNAVSHKPDPR